MIDGKSLPSSVWRAIHREPALRQPGIPAKAPETAPKPTHDSQNATHDHLDHSRQNTKLERDSGDAALATPQVQAGTDTRILVGVLSIRKRLLDEDNLCEKFLVDALKLIGAIPDDCPDKVTIATTQRKAAKGEAERTLITITYPAF